MSYETPSSEKEPRLPLGHALLSPRSIRRQWHHRVPFQIVKCPEIRLRRRIARWIDALLSHSREPPRFPCILHLIVRQRFLFIGDRQHFAEEPDRPACSRQATLTINAPPLISGSWALLMRP